MSWFATLLVPLAPQVTFTPVTADAGIGHEQCACGPTLWNEHSFLSGGAAAGDYDGDGWDDLYFARLHGPDVLYRNLGSGSQGRHLGFEDVTQASFGMLPVTRSNGCAFGDIDGDGDLDLYVTTLFGHRHLLFVNDGGTFVEEGLARGATRLSASVHRGYGASFGDYDSDGDLDLYVAEWGHLAPLDWKPGQPLYSNARLLANDGTGHFADVTAAAGIAIDATQVDADHGGFRGVFAFTPLFADLDMDGHQDIVIVGDFQTSRLFWNRGDGTFEDGTEAAGVGTDENGMGATLFDADQDGRLDLFVTSIYDPRHTCDLKGCNWGDSGNRLFLNAGGRSFTDGTDAWGVRDGGWGWGTCAFDFDHDGREDLVMTNGVDFPSTDLDEAFNLDPTRLWRNNGTSFDEVSAAVGLTHTAPGKGLILVDYDRDGDRDVLIVDNREAPDLFRNDGGNRNPWLVVRLEGTMSNARGVGARVYATPKTGDVRQSRLVHANASYLSTSPTEAHFGFAPGSGATARVEVVWPSGRTSVLEDVALSQRIVVGEP
ncbi:MAG: CRTAC1 family protein [bacterium]|nr:CRTAC1 family protein [bacterium]